MVLNVQTRAQRTSFNTLDNWGHRTPTQSKKKKDRKERLKGHSPKHIQYTRLHLYFSVYKIKSGIYSAKQSVKELHFAKEATAPVTVVS